VETFCEVRANATNDRWNRAIVQEMSFTIDGTPFTYAVRAVGAAMATYIVLSILSTAASSSSHPMKYMAPSQHFSETSPVSTAKTHQLPPVSAASQEHHAPQLLPGYIMMSEAHGQENLHHITHSAASSG